ncbi:MAG: response regulator transcription factor, partial [Chitinophagaceae bacterium]
MEVISVCIVEDNKDIRQALEQIVMMAEGFNLLGSFPNAEEALIGLPQLLPQVVLMDINLGRMSGIECVGLLKPKFPEMLFMICTVYEEDEKI